MTVRRIAVFDTISRDSMKTSRDCLSLVRSITDTGDSAGLVERMDGSLLRIIRLEGFNIPYSEEQWQVIEKSFEGALRCLSGNARIQFLVLNRPLDADRHMKEYRKLCLDDNPFLAWYADYTSAWFRKVCETRLVPNREFYVVVSVERPSTGQQAASRLSRSATVTELDRLSAEIARVFGKAGGAPSFLSRSQIRTLLYSCLRPSYPSGLSDEPVETLKPSTLPAMRLGAGRKHVLIDGTRIASQVVSDLPSKMRAGWLMDLVSLGFSSCLSIHVRPGDSQSILENASEGPAGLERSIRKRLGESASEPIELSIYLSTCAEAGSGERIGWQSEEARSVFHRYGALLSPDCDQKSAFLSGLPLGIDSGGIAHSMVVEDSVLLCPLVTASCGAATGLPLGFARASREPVFVSTAEGLRLLAVASRKRDLVFFRPFMTMRLLSTNLSILYLDDGSGSLARLVSTLGDNLVERLSCTSPGSKKRAVSAVPESPVLTIVEWIERLSPANIEGFKKLVRSWLAKISSGRRAPAIFIGDLGLLSGKRAGIEALEYLYGLARRRGVVIIAASMPDARAGMKRASAIACRHSDVRIVLPQTGKSMPEAARILELDQGDSAAVRMLETRDKYAWQCFLETDRNHGLVRLVPSPLEYWICSSLAAFEKKRLTKMRAEVKARNPRLSASDAARQTFYYLGLQA
ncbi:MAG: hypothetical protein AB7W16_14740 [Candidatus Obscuribacterales bacterium]